MARDTIKLAKQVVIVEGYVDAVIAHQHGTKQTVACIGSAITEKHIQQLKKLTRQVTLALDPDAAGASATDHGIQEALKTFDRTIVPVPLAAANHVAGRRKSHEARGMIRLEEQVDAEINVLQLPGGKSRSPRLVQEHPQQILQASKKRILRLVQLVGLVERRRSRGPRWDLTKGRAILYNWRTT